MKHLFLKFTKVTFGILFLGMSLLLVSQGMMAQKTSAQSGSWTDAATWVGGVVPNTTEYVTIASGHDVTFALTENTSIGSLSIASTGSLTVSNDFTFIIGSVSPFSNIAGSLNISGTASRTFGNLTVASTGSISSTGTGATSTGSAATNPWVNNGTITVTTLGLATGKTIENNGTFNASAIGSSSTGTFINGTTGVFNYSGSNIPMPVTLTATAAGNTVNYSGNTQLVKDVAYSTLILSGSGTKTLQQSADRTVATNLTIGTGVTLKVTSASVNSLAINNAGSGYGATSPTVTFSAAPSGGTLATGTAIMSGGTVVSIAITNPGSGYTSAPTVTIEPPTSGTTATATATILSASPTYRFTVGSLTNNGTLNFDAFAGTGDKTVTTFSNPGSTTSSVSANFICATADYSGAAQTVLAGTYTTLILSGSGTKTIGNVASSTLCTGRMTITGTAKASVTNANVGVNMLILGATGQAAATIGFTGSGAATINTAYFITGTGTLNVQQPYTIISTAVGGDWNSASTWVDGVVPTNSSADFVTIVGTATVNLTLTEAFTVGALNINAGGTLNVTGNFGFAIASRSPFSNIAGSLNLDVTTGSKSFGNITVASGGSINSLGASTSVGSSASSTSSWVNNGTISVTTLGLTTAKTIENNGIFSCTGVGSTSAGVFNNNSMGTLALNGTIAGTINNFGIMNSSALSGTSAVANITNKASGVLNFTGASMTSTTLVLDASEAGNTVNYSGSISQTVKIPTTSYSNLIFSTSGTKTIPTAASGTLCTGTMTISGTAKANVTNTNVGVNFLFLGSAAQSAGTIGFTGSGAATIDTTYFITGLGTLNVIQTYAITSTAVGGDWNSTSTWVNGVVPANSNAVYVVIVGTATVNLTLTAAFTVGALNINAGGTLNVTGNFGFTIASRSPFSNIAGSLNLDGTTGSKSFGNLTVASGGSINSLGASTSVGSSASSTSSWVNNGTISVTTLGLTTAKTIENNGIFSCTGVGSTSAGVFNNNSTGTLALNGTIAGTINNFGIMNSSALSGTSAVANITNKASGVLNFTGASMSSTTLVLNASEAGNTVNYSGASQTVKIPTTSYSNLIFSTSGTKTIPTAGSGTLCTGKMTIASGVKANVTNANVAVNMLVLNTTGQVTGTIGFTGSGASKIDTTYFITGLGTLNVQQPYAVTSTAVGGDWNTASTWVDGIVPVNSSADYVVIVGTATVTLNLTANFTVGALAINQGGRLNVSSNASANTFTIGIRSPGSTIAGALLFDASVTGGKSFGTVTVTATGSVIETTRVSISMNNGASGVLTNYGTITTNTLAMSGTNANLMKIENYGTINTTGFSSQTVGTFTNYANSVLNYTGGSIPAAMIFIASATGNTVNYSSSGSQTVRTPNSGSYSKLILSNSGTKTIDTAASGTLCTSTLTISGTAKANVTNTNVGVNILFLGSTGQSAGTIGFTGSGAATIDTVYFVSGLGTLNVLQTYSITSTAAGGDWNSASTWVDGVVPANSSADYVTIVGTATVNLTLTAGFTVGSLNIISGGTLNVTGNFGFTIANRSPFSNIAGSLTLDATTASKSFGNLTVAAGGSINSLGASTSVGSTASSTSSWVNNGTFSVINLGLTTAKTIENNAIFTVSGGVGSTSTGVFNNNSGATLNLTGVISGNFNNFGIMNSPSLSGSSVVANITNKATGVLNFTGSSMASTTLILDASEVGNTVNYSLAGSQTIKPVVYNKLILSNSGTKTVDVATSVTIPTGGVVTVNEGITLNNLGTIDNNGDIILKSSAISSGNLTSTSSINNITQQRYLSSNQRGWRLLSNPLASTTFNTLAAASGITVRNNFTGEYVTSTNTWTSTDGAAAMDTQKAYKLFITGLSGESPTYATGPSNVTLVNKGTAANTVPAPITTILGKYYLVANPYTAPVSVSRIIAASTGLSSTVAYYNPTNGATDVKVNAGGYDATTATGAGGSATDVVIPAMGAIFVQASSAGTINIPTTTIFTGTPAQAGIYNHKTAQTKTAPAGALKIEVRSGSVYYDTLSLQFKAVGEAGSNIDFGKLPNSILDVYSIAGTKKMAVSEVELATQTIPLGITSTLQKNYTFKVVENSIPAGFEAVLVDKLLNTNTVLTSGTTYSFAIDSTPASQGNARFEINLKVAGSLSVVDTELDSKIQLWPNPARDQFNILNGQNQKDGSSTIEISNLNGQIIHSYKSNPGTTTVIQTKGWAQGVYILKVKNNGNQTTKKLILQ